MIFPYDYAWDIVESRGRHRLGWQRRTKRSGEFLIVVVKQLHLPKAVHSVKSSCQCTRGWRVNLLQDIRV